MKQPSKEDRKIPPLTKENLLQQGPVFDTSSIRQTEDHSCFGVTPKGKQPLAVKVFFSNGMIAIIQYSRMLSPITYNGVDHITLSTQTLNLSIKGDNLEPILDYLAEQRLAWIGLSAQSSFMNTNQPDINHISMQPIQNAKTPKP